MFKLTAVEHLTQSEALTFAVILVSPKETSL